MDALPPVCRVHERQDKARRTAAGLAWVDPTTPADRVVIAKETEQPCLGQELGAGGSPLRSAQWIWARKNMGSSSKSGQCHPGGATGRSPSRPDQTFQLRAIEARRRRIVRLPCQKLSHASPVGILGPERVSVALELAAAPGASPDQSAAD